MSWLVMYLLYEHEDLSSLPRAYIKNAMVMLSCHLGPWEAEPGESVRRAERPASPTGQGLSPKETMSQNARQTRPED